MFEFRYKSPIVSDVLYTDGPLISVSITAPVELLDMLRMQEADPFPIFRGLAMLDSGASTSVIDVSVFRELDIPAVDRLPAQTVHGIADLETYNASACFPELGLFDLQLERVLGGHLRAPSVLGGDVVMLIGRDILRDWRFHYNGPASSFTVEV